MTYSTQPLDALYYVENETMKKALMEKTFTRTVLLVPETFSIPEENIMLPQKFDETGKVDLMTPDLSYGVITFQPEIGYRFDLTGAAYGEYTVVFVLSDARGNQVYTNTNVYTYSATSDPVVNWMLENKKLAGTGTVKVQVTVTQPDGERRITTGSFQISSEGSSSIPEKPSGIMPTIKK